METLRGRAAKVPARCATLHKETVATDEKGDTSIEEAILFHNGKSWSKSRIRSEWGTPRFPLEAKI